MAAEHLVLVVLFCDDSYSLHYELVWCISSPQILVWGFDVDMLCMVFLHGAVRETYGLWLGCYFYCPVHPFHLFSLGSHCQGQDKIAKPEAKHPVSIPTQSSLLLWVSVLVSRITQKRYGNAKVTAINHTCPNAIFIFESGLPFVSCPANIPNCWPFVHKGECEVHALENPSNTRGIICSYGQAGTIHLYDFIPGKENEPETALKELQFVAGECHLIFYSCSMLGTLSGRSCSILQSWWLICPLWVMLINLACFSLVELCMKWSGFLQMYLLFIRILRIVRTNTFQLATRSGWWLAIRFPLSMVCHLSSKSSASTSVCQWVTETL